MSRKTASHRDLHSFPTRRSSDLVPQALAVGVAQVRQVQGAPGQAPQVAGALVACEELGGAIIVGVGAREAAGTVVVRSEEHTSELQSRLHLVCRLLLEKKSRTHE